jgi:hypothetical protein
MLCPPAALVRGQHAIRINITLELGEEGLARWRG